MASKKISALTAATTPLAGTEILPIVQGGATTKVAVSDLTAGRAVSATSFAGALNGTVGATTPATGNFTTLTSTLDATIHGLTVGLGAGSISTNTAIGYQAAYSNTTAGNSTAIGYQALNAQTTASGGHNTAVGGGALKAVTTGYQNVAVGYNALNVCTGTYNVAIGDNAGGAMLASSGVVIVGGYDGNSDGLDVRNATDYVVISTGSGARQLSMKEGYTLALDSAVPVSGTGITFPATQNASSDANTLDDYEEGTWTPVLAFGGASVGVTYISGYQNGLYTKVGNIVTLTGVIYASSKGTSVGNATIEGIPFNSANTDGTQCATTPRVDTVSFVNVININLSKNTSSLVFTQTTTSGATTLMTNTNFADYSYIAFFITYRAA